MRRSRLSCQKETGEPMEKTWEHSTLKLEVIQKYILVDLSAT